MRERLAKALYGWLIGYGVTKGLFPTHAEAKSWIDNVLLRWAKKLP